jgi:TctA family transporter
MDIFGNMMIGLEAALSVTNLFYCFVGVFLGTLLGVIPGIGVLASISMLYPITFYLDPLAAVIMLAGIYYGTTYGGSTASILLNLPGTPSNAVACLDGYPMSKQGRAGVALLMTTLASFFGATIGILLMMAFSPIISAYALRFGSAENFALVVLGLMASATISPGSPMKGVASALIGIIFGIIGTDVYTGTYRFTFGMVELIEGISLVAIAMGLFGVAEVISSVGGASGKPIDAKSITFGSMLPTREDVRRSWMPMLRGSGIGSFFGALPGTGGMMAAFMTYAVEKKLSDQPEKFGHGAIEGVTAPEAANNAADQTAFIPTMTLGIPGTASMAIMLGILMLHGITPGPRLISDHPDVFWGLIMSFWIGNLMLLLLNIPMVGLWVRILAIPYHLLYPAVLVFVCIGVLSVNNNPFDIWPVIAFALVGYGMLLVKFPSAPLILGFVLGPLAEEHFRRAMLLSNGDFGTFVQRPISATILVIVAVLLVWAVAITLRPLWSRLLRSQSESI